jgi:hypothetical protein
MQRLRFQPHSLLTTEAEEPERARELELELWSEPNMEHPETSAARSSMTLQRPNIKMDMSLALRDVRTLLIADAYGRTGNN